MAQTFSGGSAKLREAAKQIDERVKWTVRMANEALKQVDDLVMEAGSLGTGIEGVNMALTSSNAIRQELLGINNKLSRLKQMIEELA